MSVAAIAHEFTELCRAGRFEEAGERFWAESVVSIEAMPGDMARLEGRAAVKGKSDGWYANHEVHGTTVEGPFPNGDQFAVVFAMDVTPKGGARMQMKEIGLYTVEDGKIVEERFFYAM
jgi:hypothetical protein